jgi:hypothetical protein
MEERLLERLEIHALCVDRAGARREFLECAMTLEHGTPPCLSISKQSPPTRVHFLVTEKNRLLELGNYRLLLPTGYYRTPFEPRKGSDELIGGSFDKVAANNYYFCRLDLRDLDDILYKAFAESCGDRTCVTHHEAQYRKEVFRTGDGDVRIGEGSFLFGTGVIDYVKTERQIEVAFQRRYQRVYHPDSADWLRCALFAEQTIS